jgi:hypothetical protein
LGDARRGSRGGGIAAPAQEPPVRFSRALMHLAAVASIWMGLALAAPADAEAQLFTRPDERFRSPKRFAFELRFGPYSPDIDSEFGGKSRPHQIFFEEGIRVMTQIELDYQFFTRFGSAAIGAQVGYFRENGKSRVETGGPNAVAPKSGDGTTLSLYPMALMLVYRADQLWTRLRVPLVPYGKIGLNYTIWNIYNGNDQVSRAETTPGLSGRGRGGTRGWQAAAGLSLALDFIDPGSARELDSETGVNHTYIFAEWAHYAVSGLGQSGRLHVGDSTWAAGLMFEF